MIRFVYLARDDSLCIHRYPPLRLSVPIVELKRAVTGAC